MRQNTESDAPSEPADDWRRLYARWSNRMASEASATVSLLSVDERAWLSLEPRNRPHTAAAEPDWVPFTRRSAHPDRPWSPIDAPYLLVVRVFADAEDRDEFRRWLDQEHSRLHVSLPGVNWYVGYEEEGSAHSFLNIWSIDEPGIVGGKAWERIRDTPWWARLSHVPANAVRNVYRPIQTVAR